MSESKEGEVVIEKEVAQEPLYTEVEKQAIEMGWKPKEQWAEEGGNVDEHRSAREFVDRGELYKSLHSLKRELRAEKEARTALQFHHKRVYETAYNKAVNDLKLQKRQAIRNDDLEAVEAIEERIEDVQREFEEVRKADQVMEKANVDPSPEFAAWTARNSWYETDEELREFADAQGIIYVNKNPGVDPNVVLKHVEAKVKSHFKEKFGGRTAAPNPVVAPRRNAKVASEVELTEDEQRVMRALVKSNTMTEVEYKAEIKKLRG